MRFVKQSIAFSLKLKKFISIEASMLDSVYHMTMKLPKIIFLRCNRHYIMLINL